MGSVRRGMEILVRQAPPCVVFEDEHILVVNKPPGWNTHSPSPYAGEGIYDWLRNREPRWATLAIIHRLDKATSGVMVFAKCKDANRSLTHQFAERRVRKSYLLLTAAEAAEKNFAVRSGIVRDGDRYKASPAGDGAETEFHFISRDGPHSLFSAEPRTGRTHQIRVHAQLHGIPILGDTVYGGAPFPRVCLHAREIAFEHPISGEQVSFRSEMDFSASGSLALRTAVIEPELTNCFRLHNGGADGHPNISLERWGDYLLAQGPGDFDRELLATDFGFEPKGVYWKTLSKTIGKTQLADAQPQLIKGSAAPEIFHVRENGIRYNISFQQGYSVGLFLDQRDNRRRLLTNYVGPDFELLENGLAGKEVLNTFAYTCGFSVCAALAGARTTSLDLSKKYLEWGKRNFAANNLEPARHDFIFGDLFDWAPRLARKKRKFDLVILDPPTFSHSKAGGVFQAEKDYTRLVAQVLPLLAANGILFASTNAHKLTPERFLEQIRAACAKAGRRIHKEHFVPQPPDFPVSKSEPAYLKTVWLRIS